MNEIKAVLFDLDGTLVDSLPELYEGVRRTAEDFHLTSPTKEAVRDMIGRGVIVLVERLCAHMGVDSSQVSQKAFLDRLVEHWAQMDGSYTEFFPGVLEGIAALREQGIKVGLVTNKWRALTDEFLQARNIAELFDVVVAGDDCPRNKPYPDMLEKAMSTLGVLPTETVMVGDSRNDALAGRAASTHVALVETGYNEGVPISEWAREAGFSHTYVNAKKVCDVILQGHFFK